MKQPENPSPSEPGEIITFYSYKGGTGRSMSMANVACLLAQRKEGHGGVLMVDWDLEAPGLHRYFADRFQRRFHAKDTRENAADLETHPGLIEFLERLYSAVKRLPKVKDEPSPEIQEMLEREADLDSFILPTDVPNVSLLKAGCFDENYARRVNTFPWEPAYLEDPWITSLLVEWLTSRFRYTLIDSRTGITDTSGICTMLLPDKLVTVFTPNQQSLDGVLQVTERATNYRRSSQDLRPLSIFPLPARIEGREPQEREKWRHDAATGYQPRFEAVFEKILGLRDCNLEPYFDEVQIQHEPFYAFGEKISVLIEQGGDRISLKRAYVAFTELLATLDEPWDVPERAPGAPTPAAAEQAESVYAQWAPAEQDAARRLILQLLRVPQDSTRPSGRELAVKLLAADELAVLDRCVLSKLITTRTNTDGVTFAAVADETLIVNWRRLSEWIASEIAFLHWRDSLDSALTNWEKFKREKSSLLRGEPLREANDYRRRRQEMLNAAEREYIDVSRRTQLRRRAIGSAAALAAACAAAAGVFLLQSTRETERDKLIGQAVLSSAEPRYLLRSILFAAQALHSGPDSADADRILHQDLALLPDASHNLGGATPATHITFSPDGNHFAVSFSDGSVRIGSVSNSDQRIIAYPSQVTSLAFSADGRWLVAGRADSSRQLISLASNYQSLLYVTGAVTAVAFSPAAAGPIYLATGTQAGEISVTTLPASQGKPPIADYSPVPYPTAGPDDPVFFIRAAASRSKAPANAPAKRGLLQMSMKGGITGLTFSPSGEALAAAAGDRTVQLWTTDTGRNFGILEHPAIVLLLTYSPDGKYLATAAADGKARIWLADKDVPAVAEFQPQGRILGMSFSSDGAFLLTVTQGGSIELFKVPGGTPTRSLPLQGPITSVSYLRKSDLMAIGSMDGTARVVSPLPTPTNTTPAELWRVVLKDEVTAVALCSDGNHLATASKSGEAFIWKLDPTNKTRYRNLTGTALANAACAKLKVIMPGDAAYSKACP